MKKFYLFMMLVLMTTMSVFAQAGNGAELCSVTLKKTGYNAYLTPVSLGGLTDGKIKKGEKVRVSVEPKGLFEISISANGNEVQKPKMVARSQPLVKEVTITEDTEILVDVQTGVMIDLYVDDDTTSENGDVELEGTVNSGGIKAAHGQEVIVKARPNAGYKVKQIKLTDFGTAKETDITASKKFTATSDNYGVEVWFVSKNGSGNEEKCSITTSATGPKSMFAMVEVSEESVKKGESIMLTAIPMTTAEVLVYVNNKKVYGPAIASAEEPLETELSINEDANIEVVFNKPATVRLDTDDIPNGTIILNNKELKDVSMGFLHNQEVVVEATADKGYVLKSIKVKVKGVADFTDITSEKKFMASEDDYILQVNFEKAEAKKETLRVYLTKDYAQTLVLKDDTGSAVELPQKHTDASGDTYYDFSLNVGAKYSIEVTAKDGYELKDMDTNFIGKVLNNEFTFNPDDDGRQKHILVNLQPKKMEVKFPKWEHGSVDRKGWHKPLHKIKFGKVIKLDVQPEEGYELESLTIGGVDVSQTLQFTVGLDNTIVAKFKKKGAKMCKVTLIAPKYEEPDPVVEIEGLDAEGKVEAGKEITIKVSAKKYLFQFNVIANRKEIIAMTPITAGESYSKTMIINEDTQIVVSSEVPLSLLYDKKGLEAQGHKVTISPVEAGAFIKPRKGGVFTVTRTRVKFDVVPAKGYILKRVIANRYGWSATSENEVVKQYDEDITSEIADYFTRNSRVFLTFEFEKVIEKKAITIPAVENGTLTLDGVNSGDKVAVGTEVAINATPADGYELESITVGGKDVTKAKKFVVGDDNTIVVKFKKITKVITIPAVENGTLTLDGVNSGDEVAVGTEVAINATPAEGYELESIIVGGKDVTKAKKFVVGDDNTIVVKFKKATAIESLNAQIKLYPNPATDYAIITGLQAKDVVKVLSLTGKVVLVQKADYTGGLRLELANLPRGLYLVRTGNKVFKLQIQ